MKEVWVEAPNFPDYEVSNLGRVKRSTPARGAVVGRILKPIQEEDGRLMLMLRRDGETMHIRPSRLVCEAFHGAPPEGMEACHNNGKPHDNAAKNLRWDTCIGNKEDMVKHGTRLKKAGHPNAKLNSQQVRRIKERYKRGELQRKIAERYGIRQSQVSRVVNGVRW